MHPAASVITFTTLSGAGFGLLAVLGLDPTPPRGWVAFGFFAIAYLLAVGGLMASALHLRHPERALRAFTQWRSSWLSREAVASVATLLVMAVYGAGLVFWGTAIRPLGWLGAALALGTVLTTSMIYASLRAVPRWHDLSVPVLYLTHAIAGGLLLGGHVGLALIALPLAGAALVLHWVRGAGAFARAGSTLASATGLTGRGAVRAFEPPHTGTSYLTREMVFEIGRRRAGALRWIALGLGYGLPVILLLLPGGHLTAGLAVLSHLAGVAAGRWLFFAEAEHVVGLYYGRQAPSAPQPKN